MATSRQGLYFLDSPRLCNPDRAADDHVRSELSQPIATLLVDSIPPDPATARLRMYHGSQKEASDSGMEERNLTLACLSEWPLGEWAPLCHTRMKSGSGNRWRSENSHPARGPNLASVVSRNNWTSHFLLFRVRGACSRLNLFSVCLHRESLATMESTVAVQTKGFGLSFQVARKSLMAAFRSATL